VGPDEHWYEIVSAGNLRQGDIIRNLAVPYFDDDIVELTDAISEAAGQAEGSPGPQVPAKCALAHWIVLDASCDVDHGEKRPPAVGQVLLARIVAADAVALNAKTPKELDERREVLRQNLVYSKYLLAECAGIEPPFPLSLVEYRQRALVPHAYVLAAALRGGPRLRLRAPMRERFGNWVGIAISRVGPEDAATIPPFLPRLHDAVKLRAVGAVS
jgi:hypothetical protein